MKDVVTQLLEHPAGDRGHVGIVLDQENPHALAEARRRGRGSAGRLRRDRPGGARQVEGDGRAAPRHAFHRGRAAGLAGEAVDLRQAEAGALPDLLGGEEWLEDAADDLGRDAGAAVGDAQGDEVAGDAQRIAFSSR